MRVGDRPGHAGPEPLAKGGDPLDVVGVVVGDPDLVEPPAPCLERGGDGRSLRCIHDRGATRPGVMHEKGVVVVRQGTVTISNVMEMPFAVS